jgi:hypothetical protein
VARIFGEAVAHAVRHRSNLRKIYMKSAITLIALAAALAVTAPAYAAGAHFNAAGKVKVAPDTHAGPDGSAVKVAYSYTRGFGTDRSKGVLAFTNPSTGIYCIQPTSATLNLAKIYPLVSIEWSTSFGESLQAFWVDTSAFSDCPAGNLEVQTWDISTGTAPVITSNVSFDVVVN